VVSFARFSREKWVGVVTGTVIKVACCNKLWHFGNLDQLPLKRNHSQGRKDEKVARLLCE